jgi:sporulation protein YlmC with PRC-barrel domain
LEREEDAAGQDGLQRTGQKVGKVEDLIVAPSNDVSYVIVGAGGFVGIGRHDVAIPVSQIQDQGGKLVMAGATKDGIKALPSFNYADKSAGREQFMARAQDDIAKGKVQVAELEKRASTAAADAKVQIEVKVTELQVDVKNAEAKLAELQRASANRWHEFEASVNAATARVRKSIERAVGSADPQSERPARGRDNGGMSDESQIVVPPSFIALFVVPGRSKPSAPRAEIAARHEFCEDLANLLTEPANTKLWELGVTEADVLERMHRGLWVDTPTAPPPSAPPRQAG